MINTNASSDNKEFEWKGEFFLKCSHAINSRSRFDYLMRCNKLKDMRDGRVKIRVFGERYWSRPESKNKHRIRYVSSCRIVKFDDV